MTKKATDKIKYINFDAFYLQHLYSATPGIGGYILGDAASKMGPELLSKLRKKIPNFWDLPNLIAKTETHPKTNFLVSCSIDDFLKYGISDDKKVLRVFAVKIALMSIARSQNWAVCRRRFLVSRLAGYRNVVSEEKLLKDKSNDWGKILKKSSKIWRNIKEELKKQGVSFVWPAGCWYFVFGFMPMDQLQYKYDCWLIDRNVSEEQKLLIMEKLGIPGTEPIKKKINLPELPLPAQEERPSEPPAHEPTKTKLQKRPKQQRPIYRDADQDFSKPETFT